MTSTSTLTAPTVVNPDVAFAVSGSTLEVRGVGKSYPRASETTKRGIDQVQVLQPVDVIARPGEFVSIVGPSGCGKSTLFSIIAGLEAPTEGAIVIDGTDHTGETGHVGYMLQKDLLLPWRTVLNNVILGLEV
ncbi:MAG TPA: ATP-binding cassette domain-containing protein, partial [Glaciihabitans sp.]|nr:ATP-binding cassette domain-containing protein [Glaciihabitans sp.]